VLAEFEGERDQMIFRSSTVALCRALSALGGVISVVLGGIGFIVRMTPPVDGTAPAWWAAAAAAFVVGCVIGLAGLVMQEMIARCESTSGDQDDHPRPSMLKPL
jgi:hypothetical protein